MEEGNRVFLSVREAISEVHRCKVRKYISKTIKGKQTDLLGLNATVFQASLGLTNCDVRKVSVYDTLESIVMRLPWGDRENSRMVPSHYLVYIPLLNLWESEFHKLLFD